MMNYLPWHKEAFEALWARRERLPHALLLYGARGIGKAAFAEAIAQRLLCEATGGGGTCGACPSCTWFANGSHPDFARLEPAVEAGDEEQGTSATKKNTQIVVEQVRGLSDFLGVSTHRGGWRIVLVNPAENLNVNAANALLKNLEEPPPRTLFVLVSHRLQQVLPTIKSRCELLPLPSPSSEEATRWLGSQGVEEARLVAAYTGGAPLAGLAPPVDGYWERRRQFLRHLTSARIDPLAAAEDCEDAGVRLMLEWLQKWTYDVAARKMSGAVRYNVDHDEPIGRIAAACDPLRMLRFHRELVRMQRHADHPLNARLVAEQLFMAYAEAASPRRTAP